MGGRNRRAPAIAGILVLAAAGCAAAGTASRLASSVQSPDSATAAVAAAIAPSGTTARLDVSSPIAAPETALPAEKGFILLTVRWPALPSTYRSQVILDSATRVLFEVKQGSTLVASTSISRAEGATGASTGSIELDAGNFQLAATALAGPAGSPVTVATGSTTLTVTAGARTAVALTLGTVVSELAGQVGEP